MTDSAALENKIKKSGFKKYFIAEQIGIEPYTLTRKINNATEFTASEIDKLCEILKVETLEERQALFFAH